MGRNKGLLENENGKIEDLKAKATRASRISKAELKELQNLLSRPPGELDSTQMRKMCELKEKFEITMPPSSSPVPRSNLA